MPVRATATFSDTMGRTLAKGWHQLDGTTDIANAVQGCSTSGGVTLAYTQLQTGWLTQPPGPSSSVLDGARIEWEDANGLTVVTYVPGLLPSLLAGDGWTLDSTAPPVQALIAAMQLHGCSAGAVPINNYVAGRRTLFLAQPVGR